ncbi:unnamed protein product [Closterium sp. Yama58-4]|nr:unnamed protein product [Closterium sp. Yama58-4]
MAEVIVSRTSRTCEPGRSAIDNPSRAAVDQSAHFPAAERPVGGSASAGASPPRKPHPPLLPPASMFQQQQAPAAAERERRAEGAEGAQGGRARRGGGAVTEPEQSAEMEAAAAEGKGPLAVSSLEERKEIAEGEEPHQKPRPATTRTPGPTAISAPAGSSPAPSTTPGAAAAASAIHQAVRSGKSEEQATADAAAAAAKEMAQGGKEEVEERGWEGGRKGGAVRKVGRQQRQGQEHQRREVCGKQENWEGLRPSAVAPEAAHEAGGAPGAAPEAAPEAAPGAAPGAPGEVAEKGLAAHAAEASFARAPEGERAEETAEVAAAAAGGAVRAVQGVGAGEEGGEQGGAEGMKPTIEQTPAAAKVSEEGEAEAGKKPRRRYRRKKRADRAEGKNRCKIITAHASTMLRSLKLAPHVARAAIRPVYPACARSSALKAAAISGRSYSSAEADSEYWKHMSNAVPRGPGSAESAAAEIIERNLVRGPPAEERSPAAVLTSRREALDLYRLVLRTTRVFVWPHPSGALWRDVLRESARKEFEAARFVSDPEMIARLLVGGRDAISVVVDKLVAKQQEAVEKERSRPP